MSNWKWSNYDRERHQGEDCGICGRPIDDGERVLVEWEMFGNPIVLCEGCAEDIKTGYFTSREKAVMDHIVEFALANIDELEEALDEEIEAELRALRRKL